jgi:excisionase family DNA binding protein
MNKTTVGKIIIVCGEAKKKLGFSIVTLDRELAKNRLPHFRVGRRVLFAQELLEKYIQQNTRNVVIRRS